MIDMEMNMKFNFFDMTLFLLFVGPLLLIIVGVIFGATPAHLNHEKFKICIQNGFEYKDGNCLKGNQ